MKVLKNIIFSKIIIGFNLVLMVLIGSYFTYGQTNQPFQEKVKSIAREINKTAKEIMNSSWLDASKPYIYIEGKKARFIPWGVDGWLGFEENDPWQIIYQSQIDYELLNQFFENNREYWFIWEKNRKNGEKIILNSIADVISGQHEIGRWQFHDQFIKFLQEDMHKYLLEHGYVIADGYGNGFRPQFKVKIRIEPLGGKVTVLPYLVYKKCKMLGQPSKEWPWRTLIGTNELLMGKYIYQAMWPGGKQDKGAIEIISDTALTFRPEAK